MPRSDRSHRYVVVCKNYRTEPRTRTSAEWLVERLTKLCPLEHRIEELEDK